LDPVVTFGEGILNHPPRLVTRVQWFATFYRNSIGYIPKLYSPTKIERFQRSLLFDYSNLWNSGRGILFLGVPSINCKKIVVASKNSAKFRVLTETVIQQFSKHTKSAKNNWKLVASIKKSKFAEFPQATAIFFQKRTTNTFTSIGIWSKNFVPISELLESKFVKWAGDPEKVNPVTIFWGFCFYKHNKMYGIKFYRIPT